MSISLRISIFATLIVAILLPGHVNAFSPGGSASFLEGEESILELPFGEGVISAILAAGKSHETITEDALNEIYKEYGFGDNSDLKPLTSSMKKAINDIKVANADIDRYNALQSRHHCDAEQLRECSDLISEQMDLSVQYLKNGLIYPARRRLGSAFHTLQDFYSHSNWIELGNHEPNSSLGKSDFPGPTYKIAFPEDTNKCYQSFFSLLCDESNIIKTGLLISGYFSGQDRTPLYKLGMCRHGGLFDKTAGMGGINKDSSTCGYSIPTLTAPYPIPVSPHADLNPTAEAVAIKATIAALHDIRSRVTDPQFKALLGFGPSLGFAIDTTGSMGNEIAGVLADVRTIIEERKGTLDEPMQYVLSPFNDPSVGPLTNTSDPNIFKNNLSALFADGGGDCPELSQQGAYNAIAAMEGNGQVIGYTDASSKDADKESEVYSLAKEKNIKFSWALYGSCSPYDPAYFNLANRTGGQVFILPRGQTSGVSQLANLLSRSNAADILSISGQVTTTTVIHDFPVDSTITRLTVSITSTDTTTITVKRPDGSVITASDVGVTQVPITPSIGSTAIFSIANPHVGQWQISLQGSGDYSVLVNGDSTIALDRFDFVRLGGRPGHHGYYPIDGLPLVGVPQKAIARLSGKTNGVHFELRANDGVVKQTFTLDSPQAEAGDLLGEVTIPTELFGIYALGTDENGYPFQRVIATKLIPQRLSVTPPVPLDLGRGQETTYIMQVKNDGIPDLVNFKALDNNKYVKSVTPSSANIATGKTQNVKVILQPPASALIGTPNSLTFTAKSNTDPDVINYAVLVSSVVDSLLAGDVNRDGKADCNDLLLVKASFGSKTGNLAFNPAVDLDTNGIVDVRDLALVARKLPAGLNCQ